MAEWLEDMTQSEQDNGAERWYRDMVRMGASCCFIFFRMLLRLLLASAVRQGLNCLLDGLISPSSCSELWNGQSGFLVGGLVFLISCRNCHNTCFRERYVLEFEIFISVEHEVSGRAWVFFVPLPICLYVVVKSSVYMWPRHGRRALVLIQGLLQMSCDVCVFMFRVWLFLVPPLFFRRKVTATRVLQVPLRYFHTLFKKKWAQDYFFASPRG